MEYILAILPFLFFIALEKDIIRARRAAIRPIFVLRKNEDVKTYINDGNGPAFKFELYLEEGWEKKEILIEASSVLKKESLDFSKLEKGKYMIRYEDVNTYVYKDEILIE